MSDDHVSEKDHSSGLTAARRLLEQLEELLRRDFAASKELTIDQARLVVACAMAPTWNSGNADEDQVNRDLQAAGVAVARRWSESGGVVVTDLRVFAMLSGEMSEAERADHLGSLEQARKQAEDMMKLFASGESGG